MKKTTSDQWIALAILQGIAFYIAPFWKALLVIPMMLLLVLPFWFFEQQIHRCRESGKSAWIWHAAIWVFFLAFTIGGWIYSYNSSLDALMQAHQ